MRARADRMLYNFLSKIIDLGCTEETEILIRDAQDYMGHWSPFRGTRDFVGLLEFARDNAVKEKDKETSQRLTVAVDYALNRVNSNGLNAEYELGEGALDREVQYTQMVVSQAFQLALDQIRKEFDELTQVTGSEVVARLEELQTDAQRMFPEPGLPGHYRVPRGRAEIAQRFKEILEKRIIVETGGEPTGVGPIGAKEVDELARNAGLHSVLDGVEVQRRRDALALLRSTALNPHTLEADLQRGLEKNPWIFGGRFVDLATHRLLAPGRRSIFRCYGRTVYSTSSRSNVPTPGW